jgi:hypothetical protein
MGGMPDEHGRPDMNAPTRPSAPAHIEHETPPAGPPIIAISTRNDFVHYYRSQEAVLDDVDIGTGCGESPVALEFFDETGRRYAGVFRHWHLIRLEPTEDPPDLDRLRKRLDEVYAGLRSWAGKHPDVLELYGLTADEAEDLFPPIRSNSLGAALLHFSALGTKDFPLVRGDGHNERGVFHVLIHHPHRR